MDFDKLNALMDWMAATPLAELEWSAGEQRIRLVRERGGIAAAPKPVAPEDAPPIQAEAGETTGGETTASEIIGAPFAAVVHLTPAPDAPPYVTVGQCVEVGETLCILEAMKAFTALGSEVAGEVAAILVRAGEPVVAGQPLFRITPL